MGNIKTIAVMLIVVLASQPMGAAASQTLGAREAAIKAQLDKIPIGSTIEVKLLQEDRSKIKGKLLSVTSDSFDVQTGQSGKITKQRIAFADTETVKKCGMRRLYKVLIVVGIVGVVCAVGGIWASKNIGI